MQWVRKAGVHVLSAVLLLSLLGAAGSFGINQTLGSPQKVKSLLASSKIYDKITSSALSRSQEDQSQSNGPVSLKDPAVQQAADQAFTPQFLQSKAEAIIDANYAWLQGKTKTPQFSVDLSSSKDDFAKRVGDYVTTRLAGLPTCTALQEAQIAPGTDPLTLSCRPAAVDPTAEGNQVRQQIESGDFLSNPVVTQNSVGRDQNSQKQPYYQRLANLPKLYRLEQKAPWILGILALLCAVGIIFVAIESRRGWRRLVWIFVEAGVILLLIKFLADWLAHRLEHIAVNNSVGKQLDQPTNDFINHVESQLTHNNLWFALLYLLIALAIGIYLLRTRHKPQVETAMVAPEADGPNPGKAAARTRLKKIPSANSPAKPKKPPRLIQ